MNKCEICGKPTKLKRNRFCSRSCKTIWQHAAGRGKLVQAVEDRFWPKVQKTSTCWLWIAGTNEEGYGLFNYQGRSHYAHRIAWFLKFGEFPLQNLLHSCDNPPCVRPFHLTEGTQQDNLADMRAKGRDDSWGWKKGLRA